MKQLLALRENKWDENFQAFVAFYLFQRKYLVMDSLILTLVSKSDYFITEVLSAYVIKNSRTYVQRGISYIQECLRPYC